MRILLIKLDLLCQDLKILVFFLPIVWQQANSLLTSYKMLWFHRSHWVRESSKILSLGDTKNEILSWNFFRKISWVYNIIPWRNRCSILRGWYPHELVRGMLWSWQEVMAVRQGLVVLLALREADLADLSNDLFWPLQKTQNCKLTAIIWLFYGNLPSFTIPTARHFW